MGTEAASLADLVRESPSDGDGRKPTVVIEARKRLLHLDLRGIWEYRQLLYFLVWREVKVRYKQTAIGIAWAILQPVITMLLFSVVFGNFAKIPSDGLPYPIFAFAALLPWNYFSQAMNLSSLSLVGDANLLRKVSFPRLVIPLASAATPAVDFACSFLVLLGMLLWFGITPSRAVLAIPFLLLFALATALAVGLWLAPLNVKYRDIRHVLPFVTQVWLYASPVVYPVSLVPERWRALYSLNPMAGVIEGFRWGLLAKPRPDLGVITVSAAVVALFLLGGLIYFKKMERTFADVV